MKTKGKKILDIILNILLVVIILVAATMTLLSLCTKEQGVSNIFGYIPLSVQTSSMDKTIRKGDLIITKVSTEDVYKEGDIISFFTIQGDKTIIKTHRIVEVKNAEKMISYVTKGDNNKAPDEYEVAPGDIISVYDGTRISKVGYILDLLKKQSIFFIFIIVPLFGLFVYQLYNFIVEFSKKKKNNLS